MEREKGSTSFGSCCCSVESDLLVALAAIQLRHQNSSAAPPGKHGNAHLHTLSISNQRHMTHSLLQSQQRRQGSAGPCQILTFFFLDLEKAGPNLLAHSHCNANKSESLSGPQSILPTTTSHVVLLYNTWCTSQEEEARLNIPRAKKAIGNILKFRDPITTKVKTIWHKTSRQPCICAKETESRPRFFDIRQRLRRRCPRKR